MSGYFQRLAQRTGLVVPPSRGADAQGQIASSGNSSGLELEQIVEASPPGSARGASAPAHEPSRNEATGSRRGTDHAMPPPTSRARSGQPRTSLQNPRLVSTAAPSVLAAVHDAAVPPPEHVQSGPPIEEREKASTVVSATNITPHILETDSAAPAAAQLDLLEPGNQQPNGSTRIDASPPPVQDYPLRPHAKDSAPLRTRPQRESTERFGRPATDRPPTIDIRIGSVAVEVHQAAPQPIPLPAVAPRPAAPRERISLSRHYLRAD